jgi:hypothetical protein
MESPHETKMRDLELKIMMMMVMMIVVVNVLLPSEQIA